MSNHMRRILPAEFMMDPSMMIPYKPSDELNQLPKKLHNTMTQYSMVKLHQHIFDRLKDSSMFKGFASLCGSEEPIELTLKGLERIFTKVMNEYDGDINRIKDMVRGRIICKDIDEVRRLLLDIRDKDNTVVYDDKIEMGFKLADDDGKEVMINKGKKPIKVVLISVNMGDGYLNTHWVLLGLPIEVKFEIQIVNKVSDDHLRYEIMRMVDVKTFDALTWAKFETSSILSKLIQKGTGAKLYRDLELMLSAQDTNVFNQHLSSLKATISKIVYNTEQVLRMVRDEFRTDLRKRIASGSSEGSKSKRHKNDDLAD